MLSISFLSNGYSQVMNKTAGDIASTLYFTIQPLDNWMYQTYSNTAMAEFMNFGPVNAIQLSPVELEDENNKTSLVGDFTQNEKYSFKNSPLTHYEKYLLKDYISPQYWNVIKNENNYTIDGEKTLRIIGNSNNTTVEDSFKDSKFVFYATLHDNSAYLFSLFGDSKSFDKYLDEFEQMVKSIKWVD